ncbi:MAG: ATP-binding protein [Candidatus Bathyarchaeota archaeon]|nr:ATP-binding protein [Candidatus Termiticorpusculum sp.]
MSLFDIPPKHDPQLLYSREKELADLVKYIQEKRWTILLGPRRVGKTSLAKCAIKQSGYQSMILDARENANFTDNLLQNLTHDSNFQVTGNITVPNMPYISLGASYSKQALKKTLDIILKGKKQAVLLLDEAQWFSDRRTLTMMLAHLYDYHYDTVTPIITGSAVGVLKSILEPDSKSPLFGRPIMQIDVKKWHPSISMSFLKKGLEQNKLSLNTELLVKTVELLDGLPGWLTMFGYYYTANPSNYSDAVNKTLGEALKIVNSETDNIGKLARGWSSHLKLLTELSSGSKSFTELLSAPGQSTNSALSKHLDMLQRLNYVEKRPQDGHYEITDPIMTELLKRKTSTK